MKQSILFLFIPPLRCRALASPDHESVAIQVVSRHGGVPQNGISLLARLPEYVQDDLAVIDTAIDMGRFSAIPGSAFGALGGIRFGYAGIPLDGIERLATTIPEVLDAVS